MINQELKNFNKFYSFKLKTVVLFFMFIFCFEGIAGPCEEALSSSTRTQSAKSSSEYSVRSAVWRLSNGTGFFIAPNKLITNFHVIAGTLRYTSKVEDITLSQEGSTRTLKIKGVLAVSALHDLALLETVESVEHYLSIRRNPLQAQEDVFITGYPNGELKDMRRAGDNTMFSENGIFFSVNHSSFTGASGSPLVDAKKQVIGVLYSSDNFNLIFSMHLNDLRAFAQRSLRNKPRNNLRQVVKKEIQNLRNLAKQNAKAQVKLGLIYYGGQGVTQNFEKAADMFKQAAEQGNVQAQSILGKMYYEGQGVTQNFEKAADLFKQAAQQGDIIAQAMIGVMYYEGQGVTKNPEMAIHWWKQAVEKGYAPSQYALGLVYYQGKEVTQNFEKAADLFKQAAEQGYPEAQSMLANM